MTVHGVNVLDPIGQWPHMAQNVRLWDCGVTWADLNPQRGVFYWDRLDAIINAHPKVRFTLVLSGTPQWAAKDPQSLGAPWLPQGSNSPPAEMRYWTDFVTEVALRYQDRMNAYEIWNEPMLRDFWYPYGEIDQLARMTRSAKKIFDRIDPGALIVGAAVLPRPSSGGMKRSSTYLKALAKVGWPIDVHNAHIYPTEGGDVSMWREYAVHWMQGLVLTGAPRRLMWVTETNYNLLCGALPDAVQKARIIRTDKLAKDLRIARVFWYAWGQHSDPKVMGIPLYPGTAGAGTLARYL